MAFLDFSDTAIAPPARVIPALAPRLTEPADEFTPLEWRVLSLSRHDGLETLRPYRQRSRLARLVLGPKPPSKVLANERLEALRRLAVDTRHNGWHVRPSAIAGARAAGFSDAQIARVIDTLGDAFALQEDAA